MAIQASQNMIARGELVGVAFLAVIGVAFMALAPGSRTVTSGATNMGLSNASAVDK